MATRQQTAQQARDEFADYLGTLADVIAKLVEPAMTRRGAAKMLYVAVQSAIREAERFNLAFPQESPIGPDDFTWIVEFKSALLEAFGRDALEEAE